MEKGMEVILVDQNDQEIGTCGKMEAHQEGLLHRAFSVFIFNRKGEMLLQQRALNKYHSGGLWSNTCCSHPFPGEETSVAAQRRLEEELGFKTALKKVFEFAYRADFGNGLTENEFDHVYAGEYEGAMVINTEEVMDCSFKTMTDIRQGLSQNPGLYTAWFHLAFPKIETWWSDQ